MTADPSTRAAARYAVIRLDVLDALVGAQLTACEYAIVLAIIRRTWGAFDGERWANSGRWPYTRTHAPISLSEMVKATRFSERQVVRAVQRLVAASVVTRGPAAPEAPPFGGIPYPRYLRPYPLERSSKSRQARTGGAVLNPSPSGARKRANWYGVQPRYKRWFNPNLEPLASLEPKTSNLQPGSDSDIGATGASAGSPLTPAAESSLTDPDIHARPGFENGPKSAGNQTEPRLHEFIEQIDAVLTFLRRHPQSRS